MAFARAVAYNYLIRGSDAHAQNYSLLITPGNVRLAPLYDLNTTLPFGSVWARRMAMKVGGEDRFDRIDRASWDLFARDLGLAPEWLLSELADLAGRLPDALADVRSAPDLAGVTTAGSLFQDRLDGWLGEALRH